MEIHGRIESIRMGNLEAWLCYKLALTLDLITRYSFTRE